MAKGISAEAREDILVQAFLTCPNISEISKKTKIPRPTIYTVIHSDSFQRKYSEARNEAVTGAIAYLQKSWYTKCTEEYPEIKAMLESEQRFEIIGALRRMPQNFLFKGLPDDIKDDYKLMDF